MSYLILCKQRALKVLWIKFMKNKFVIITIFILLISGCANKSEISKNDFVIINKSKTYLCEMSEKNLRIIDTVKTDKNNKNLLYMSDYTLQDEDNYYLYTTTSTKLNNYLQVLSKEDLSIISIEAGNILADSLSDDGLFTVSSYLTEMKVKKYSKELKLEDEKLFSFNGLDVYPCAMYCYKDKLYIIYGLNDRYGEYGKVETYILILDENLAEVNRIDLELDNGSYLGMFISNDKIYMSRTNQGLSESYEPVGTNGIDVYDLRQGTLSKDVYLLEEKFPMNMKYDQTNNCLLIRHEQYTLGYPCYSILNLDNGDVRTIYPDISNEPDNVIYTEINNGNYYFLCTNSLFIYSYENNRIDKIDISCLGDKRKSGIFFMN